MKNILLPTDLSIQSLWPAKKILQDAGEACTIHIIHMVEMPSGIADLLFFRRNSRYASLPPAFVDALEIFRNKATENNVQVHFEFVYGSSKRLLQNLLESRNIDEVMLLDNYNYQFREDDSVDFIPFFKKIKIPLNYHAANGSMSGYQELSFLFQNESQESTEAVEEKELQPAFAI